MRYPTIAQQNKIQGKIYVEFVVDKSGKITKVRTVKGLGYGCDEEGERVLKNSRKWILGKHRGQPIEQRIILPITFNLN